MGKRGPKPKKTVSTAWSSELAYAVGLIATDGNLSIDGRHIDFTSKDRELVVTFKRCLHIDSKVGKKTSGHTGKKDYFRVQFSDVNFYNWLLECGFTPKKSKTIGKLAIPDKYFFDFLRGCFDGDGCIYAYWDPRWRSSYMFYVQFASASPLFLEWLQDTVCRLTSARGTIQKSSRSFKLSFAKAASRTLIDRMYHRDEVPCLWRKLAKIKKILRIDDEHNGR